MQFAFSNDPPQMRNCIRSAILLYSGSFQVCRSIPIFPPVSGLYFVVLGCVWHISTNKKNHILGFPTNLLIPHLPCKCCPRPPGGTWPTPFGPWCWGCGWHIPTNKKIIWESPTNLLVPHLPLLSALGYLSPGSHI